MKKLLRDNNASAWPIVIFIIVLAIASFLVLLLGHVNEPFLNLIDSSVHLEPDQSRLIHIVDYKENADKVHKNFKEKVNQFRMKILIPNIYKKGFCEYLKSPLFNQFALFSEI